MLRSSFVLISAAAILLALQHTLVESGETISRVHDLIETSSRLLQQKKQKCNPSRNLFVQETPIEWGLDRVDQLLSRSGVFSYDFLGTNVNLFVVDSGIDAKHVDFSLDNPNRVQAGMTAYPQSWMDQNIPGNFDDYSHGTHVASIAGGRRYGIAKGVNLIPVRVLDSGGSGSTNGLLRAFDWIIQQITTKNLKRVVVNLSLDAGFQQDVDVGLSNLRKAGAVIVHASGNYAVNTCGRMGGSRHVISVGSIDRTEPNALDPVSSFSNWGSCLSLFAPGGRIPAAWTKQVGDVSTIKSGTSMATPHVAGIAALFWAKYPTWSNEQIRQRLIASSARDMLDFSKLASRCTGVTCGPNMLVQSPQSDIFVLNSKDTIFTNADFGPATAFWPRLTGRLSSLTKASTCSASTGDGSLLNPPAFPSSFALVDFSSCNEIAPSAYEYALKAQALGYLGLVVVSKFCRSFHDETMEIPSAVPSDQVYIPTICVEPSEFSGDVLGKSVELGLPRAEMNPQFDTFSFRANGNFLNGLFYEWRVEWSATAQGQTPNAFCVQFNQDFVSGVNPVVSFAFSSREIAELNPTATLANQVESRYVIRVSSTLVEVFKNQRLLASQAMSTPVANLKRLFARMGQTEGKDEFVIELGQLGNNNEMLGNVLISTVDPLPLININSFSFSANAGSMINFANIQKCASPTLSGGLSRPTTYQSGSGGGGVIVLDACQKLRGFRKCIKNRQCVWRGSCRMASKVEAPCDS